MGPNRCDCTDYGRHDAALPRTTCRVVAALERDRSEHDSARVRRFRGYQPPRNRRSHRRSTTPHRGLQNLPTDPARKTRRAAVVAPNNPDPSWHPSHLFRTSFRMGLSRCPNSSPNIQRRPSNTRRPATEVSVRRGRRETHTRRSRCRPNPPSRHRDAHPNRAPSW